MTTSFCNSISMDDRFNFCDRERTYVFDICSIKTYDAKYHYLINFINPKDMSECLESILLINNELEFDEAQFHNLYYYKKFNIDNYKIIYFSKLFKDKSIRLSLTNRTFNIITANGTNNVFKYSINLNINNSVKLFLTEITNCCNQMQTFYYYNFDKFHELALLLSNDITLAKSSLNKAIALEEKLEYLVTEPKFNIDQYKELVDLLVINKRLNTYQFTLNNIKFSISNKKPLLIEVSGFKYSIIIDSSRMGNLKRMALILENLNIFNKFKDNINYYLLTSM